MPRTRDEHGKGKQPRTVTVTRPAEKWVLKEAAGASRTSQGILEPGAQAR